MTLGCVLVRPAPDDNQGGLPRLVIGHGPGRELASRLTAHTSSEDTGLGTTLAERLGATEQVYLAPEVFSTESSDGPRWTCSPWELFPAAGRARKLTRPAATYTTGEPGLVLAEDPTTTVDPMSGHPGEALDGHWEVLPRLGSGSIAAAFLCQRLGSTSPEVLKVAKDEERAVRLRD